LNQNPGSPSAVLASVAVVRLRKVVSMGGGGERGAGNRERGERGTGNGGMKAGVER
jgi:hypothetical protein